VEEVKRHDEAERQKLPQHAPQRLAALRLDLAISKRLDFFLRDLFELLVQFLPRLDGPVLIVDDLLAYRALWHRCLIEREREKVLNSVVDKPDDDSDGDDERDERGEIEVRFLDIDLRHVAPPEGRLAKSIILKT